jgi:hypothetical protein
MVSTRNPETMTESERRQEITALLAAALLRAVRQNRETSKSPKVKKPSTFRRKRGSVWLRGPPPESGD